MLGTPRFVEHVNTKVYPRVLAFHLKHLILRTSGRRVLSSGSQKNLILTMLSMNLNVNTD
jgi:hypothetical protein